ncbi:NAD-dependent epimerase/dehydratase family protein [Cellulomonas edaphi]|uniref:NAD(P)-dependent oxidoreductase n=1 Tax=Cellulomonas edaphi TaxID=3053468 RepID=A0ABT7S3A1_9CELL|nr:NAD(P)-dependent oxidoreductase [Cellulomons edaphi]MDM7830096.1 NAD(P)-dependent oxidoreductase [Cellulomons edaphi]
MSRIAITGSSGAIGGFLRPRLRAAGHRLVLVDSAEPDELAPGEEAVTADIRELDALAAAFAGADLVVHLAGHAQEREWPDILAVNIDGTRAVCEAARRAGVTRLLLASSVHAAGFLPTHPAVVGAPAPRPDTYYGVSKAALEALGSLYADRFGMTVISARIMHATTEPQAAYDLGGWLSPDDATRLVLAALTTPNAGHHVVWGVSRNTRRVVDLGPGAAIGFEPVDDAEHWADTLGGLPTPATADRLGGDFTLASHPLGEDWRQLDL